MGSLNKHETWYQKRTLDSGRPESASIADFEAVLVEQLRATFMSTLYEPIPPRLVERLEALFEDPEAFRPTKVARN